MTGLTFFGNFFLCVCSNNSILWTGVELVLQVKRYLGLNQPQWEREHRLAFPFFFFPCANIIQAGNANSGWAKSTIFTRLVLNDGWGWGLGLFLRSYFLQRGEVSYVLLYREEWTKEEIAWDYLLSRRLRPAMCCSKDLTPNPLLFLVLSTPSSLTGVDASCLSLQSCGELRLFLSDLYWK